MIEHLASRPPIDLAVAAVLLILSAVIAAVLIYTNQET